MIGRAVTATTEAARGERGRADVVDPTPTDSLVSFDGVWRHWGRGVNRWAVLRGIDLQVPAGTAICISGGNGAGKTTLLRIATGILSPDRGTVSVDGITPDGHWRRYHQRIGYLSAGDRGLYARLSVRAHLDYWAKVAFMPRADRQPAAEEALVRFGVSGLGKLPADRRSDG